MFQKLLCVLLLVAVLTSLHAQKSGTAGIAPFVIKQLNGKTFTYKQLKPGTPTALIYFSPTCDHCKNFTQELLKHKKGLAGKQLVMVTFGPAAQMKPFDSLYHITSLPNFTMGTENYTFIVQKYYGVQRFPFVVLYNSKGKKVKTIPFADDAVAASEAIVALH